MADPRFFEPPKGPFTFAELARIAAATPLNPPEPERVFRDIAALEEAEPDAVSFLLDQRYLEALLRTRAGACVVPARFAEAAPVGMALLVAENPHRAYALLARAFHPLPAFPPGIDPTAQIDATAVLGAGARVGPGAVVGRAVVTGANSDIGANAVIGNGVRIGDDVEIGAGASLGYCLVGSRVLIHAGVRIGTRGFGFAMSAEGHLDIPQLGRVIIGDDVEIGANSTVDRGSGPDTIIGDGTKIDNLVQIGHNVRIGRGCVIVAQAGVAGSTVLEDYAVIAAQGGVAGHLRIGRGARIGAKAGVMRDVGAGESVIGSPAMPVREFFRTVAILTRLAKKRGG
ncbi:MAG: UDP-3-O-(3-hydroxymyristoyl)glucosamine N-acyltransferase [Alphaproteobacteria bacterium]|nr:UDP-3-O-(3-hydroxymyristoyl)glucosamine N-acyltransferase [Alphaproteobacteria bacterium]